MTAHSGNRAVMPIWNPYGKRMESVWLISTSSSPSGWPPPATRAWAPALRRDLRRGVPPRRRYPAFALLPICSFAFLWMQYRHAMGRRSGSACRFLWGDARRSRIEAVGAAAAPDRRHRHAFAHLPCCMPDKSSCLGSGTRRGYKGLESAGQDRSARRSRHRKGSGSRNALRKGSAGYRGFGGA